LEREGMMAKDRMPKRGKQTAAGVYWLPGGRLLTPVLMLLGLILPTANAWAQG
jgi:hypothetical protein